jgi:hypothetical protein
LKTHNGSSQKAVATHLDMSQQRVAQFVRNGAFPLLENGKLDVDACRVIYIRWLRDQSRKLGGSAAADRLLEARAAEIELRTAGRLETLRARSLETVIECTDEILGPLKPDMLAIPARLTRDLLLRRQLEEAIETTFNAAADRILKKRKTVGKPTRPSTKRPKPTGSEANV